MSGINHALARTWTQVAPRFLPFADAASSELPLPRLLRLALFQVSVGMAVVLLNGTLNRVMIVELGLPSGLVALMLAIPLLFAPFRALVGFRSDTHRSVLGWRRVPYIWMGTMLMFGGLAIMPFALLVLSGDTHGPVWIGTAGAALAFLLAGIGLHTTQTAGLALATDLAPKDSRPRVVALLYVMLLVGMALSALLFGWVLQDFTQLRLIQVVQGVALASFLMNGIALWKQEPRNPGATGATASRPAFREAWRRFASEPGSRRFLVVVALGTAAFSMQDILLEPYGGEILGLSVGATTQLTAYLAAGTLAAFALAARRLDRGANSRRLAASGALVGIFAFAAVIFSSPLGSTTLFQVGTALIGFGSGLFGVGTLIAAMELDHSGYSGLVLGAWGAAQATSAGVAIAAGGAIRDLFAVLDARGLLGAALDGPAAGYMFVYHIEIALLFAALVALGPLVRHSAHGQRHASAFGMAEFPG